MGLDVALSGSLAWNLTMVPGGGAGPDKRLFLESPVTPRDAQTSPLLFFSHLSTTYLYTVVAPSAGGPHDWQDSR